MLFSTEHSGNSSTLLVKLEASDGDHGLQAIVDGGMNFVDTAELYGFGESEKLLGDCIKAQELKPVVSTKFAPYPWLLVHL